MNGQQEIVNRKKIPIDNDGPVSKKVARNQQKNLNKSLASSKMMQEFQDNKLQTKKESMNSQQGSNSKKIKLEPKIQKKLNDIKAILQHHKEETILRVLQKHNYDQQEALEQLFNLPMDDDPGQKTQSSALTSQHTKKEKRVKQSKQQIGNQILNEMYENEQEIDPSEFEQLFAEITNIIKEEEKNNGMDLFQINQFIDDCYLIKNFILEDQAEIYLDEDDQLCKQTQNFMEELIKNRVALEIKRQQQFPTLGAVDSNNKANKKGTIQMIQDQYKQEKRKEDFFTPSRVPQVQSYNRRENFNSVYSLNNDPRSYEDILQLSKEYNDMGIDKLKLIYIQLHDINLCKSFLDRYYPDKKRAMKVEKFQDKKPVKDSGNTNRGLQKPSYKRLEDENFKNYSLKQIRSELDHLFKLRTMFRMTKGKTTNIAHRKQLQRLARRDDPRIEKLCEVARFKAIEEMVKTNPQFIDLHGYRQEEIDQLFDEIEDMIKLEFKRGNSKLETTKSGNNVYCVVKALTGKGLHSKYNKSVLKPALLDWCSRSGAKATESEDSINVFIEVR